MKQLAGLLAKLEPGLLPYPVFLQVARLVTLPIVEIVPLRKTRIDTIEILLTKRPDDDPHWPGKLHTPGTVIRATDSEGSYEDAFERILEGELAGIKTSQPVFVQNLLHHEGRGMADAHIYYVEVYSEPFEGSFYDVDHLPETIAWSQPIFIETAVSAFRAAKETSA
jgi:hypothetical protein